MSRPLISRPCLRLLQQHGLRPLSSEAAASLRRDRQAGATTENSSAAADDGLFADQESILKAIRFESPNSANTRKTSRPQMRRKLDEEAVFKAIISENPKSANTHETVPQEHETVPHEHETAPHEHETVLHEHEAIPYEHETVLREHMTVPREHRTVPRETSAMRDREAILKAIMPEKPKLANTYQTVARETIAIPDQEAIPKAIIPENPKPANTHETIPHEHGTIPCETSAIPDQEAILKAIIPENPKPANTHEAVPHEHGTISREMSPLPDQEAILKAIMPEKPKLANTYQTISCETSPLPDQEAIPKAIIPENPKPANTHEAVPHEHGTIPREMSAIPDQEAILKAIIPENPKPSNTHETVPHEHGTISREMSPLPDQEAIPKAIIPENPKLANTHETVPHEHGTIPCETSAIPAQEATPKAIIPENPRPENTHETVWWGDAPQEHRTIPRETGVIPDREAILKAIRSGKRDPEKSGNPVPPRKPRERPGAARRAPLPPAAPNLVTWSNFDIDDLEPIDRPETRRKRDTVSNLNTVDNGDTVADDDTVDNIWLNDLAMEKKIRSYQKRYFRRIFSDAQVRAWASWCDHYEMLLLRMADGDKFLMPEDMGWVLDREAVEAALGAWSSRDDSFKEKAWPTLMYSALWSCPDRALAVLETTLQDYRAPGYAIAHALSFLSRLPLGLDEEEQARHTRSVAQATITILDKAPEHMRLKQNTIYHIVKNLDADLMALLYQAMRRYGQTLHPVTLARIASGLANVPQHKQMALEIVIDIASRGDMVVNSPVWLSLCTSILSTTPEEAKFSDEVSVAYNYDRLLETGFTPNLINYTALIRSLYLSGQPEKAGAVFNAALQQNITPDLILWSTVLAGGKKERLPEIVNYAVKEAVRNEAIDVIFLNELLHTFLRFAQVDAGMLRSEGGRKSRAIPAIGPMLRFYSKVFHLAPLQALLPINLSGRMEMNQDHEWNYLQDHRWDDWQLCRQLFPVLDRVASIVTEKLEPTNATLAIMFSGYVRSLQQPFSLIMLYSHLRQQITRGDPVVTALVRENGTLVYDLIIMALCWTPRMLRAALDVFNDMLQTVMEERRRRDKDAQVEVKERRRLEYQQNSSWASPAIVDSDSSSSGSIDISDTCDNSSSSSSKPVHPAPSIYSWSILLHGLMCNGETESGERLFNMMREHGMEPSKVTWNTLVSGYARNQKVQKTVNALQGLGVYGYEADEWTIKGFSRLVQGEKALLNLKQTIDHNWFIRNTWRLAEKRAQQIADKKESRL